MYSETVIAARLKIKHRIDTFLITTLTLFNLFEHSLESVHVHFKRQIKLHRHSNTSLHFDCFQMAFRTVSAGIAR